jgi:hypothetical protein
MQQRFLAAVLDEAPLADAVDPPDAVAFYRATVRSNHRAALASTYPVVERLVGAAFFAEAARAYGAAHPSVGGDLHRFGDCFATFLEGYDPARSLAYLPDVARLEWAVHESAHAADAPPFDFAALAAVAEDEQGALRVRLAPAARWLAAEHPVVAIWQANQPDRDGSPDRTEGADRVLVHRVGTDVVVETLDAHAWELLAALAAGASLEHATAALGAQSASLPSLLARWIAGGVIAAFERDAADP